MIALDTEQNSKIKIITINDQIKENQKDKTFSPDRDNYIKHFQESLKVRPLSPTREFMKIQSM